MTNLPTLSTAPRARLPLILATPSRDATSRALVASNLLIHLLLGQNIVCIFYSKCTFLMDTILFGPPTRVKVMGGGKSGKVRRVLICAGY